MPRRRPGRSLPVEVFPAESEDGIRTQIQIREMDGETELTVLLDVADPARKLARVVPLDERRKRQGPGA